MAELDEIEKQRAFDSQQQKERREIENEKMGKMAARSYAVSRMRELSQGGGQSAEDAIDQVAQKTASKIDNWAFGALFTLIGTAPAFIWLNVHMIFGKDESKFLKKMPVWKKGGTMLVDLALLLLIMIIPVILYAAMCGNWWGRSATWLASAVGVMPDYCNIGTGSPTNVGSSGGAGGGGTWGSMDITITSATRLGDKTAQGTPSAHGRGEAVDIALLNPTVPIHGSDPRIAQLVALGKSVGFVPSAGDTLDEYANPAANATGGHVHVEFNLRPDGSTYCDGSKIPNSGPADLVRIPASIPVSGGTSDPRVRPCMLTAITNIFKAAKTK